VAESIGWIVKNKLRSIFRMSKIQAKKITE
jgi:hypothetical protein